MITTRENGIGSGTANDITNIDQKKAERQYPSTTTALCTKQRMTMGGETAFISGLLTLMTMGRHEANTQKQRTTMETNDATNDSR